MAAQSIALFGASGNTGSAVLSLALEKGYMVKAMVRTPSKVKVQHANLTLIQGDFGMPEKIKETVSGCDYVVSVAGGPMGKAGAYPKGMMLKFVQELVPIMKQTATVKCFLYQAGFLARVPEEQDNGSGLPCGTWFARRTVARNLEPNLQDHESVMRFLEHERKGFRFATIVTCPPVLKDGEATRTLAASAHRSFATNLGGVSFKELAVFTLRALKDETLHGTCTFVVRGEPVQFTFQLGAW